MNIIRNIVIVVLSAVLCTACVTPPKASKSALELQAFQAREFPTTKRIAFSSIMSVFQDMGFIIENGDFDTGLISATGPTSKGSEGPPKILDFLIPGKTAAISRHQRATAFVESMPSGLVRIRLNFVNVVWNSLTPGTDTSDPVHLPRFYQNTFNLIDQAVFVRTASE